MFFCGNCQKRAIQEFSICKQKDDESVIAYYERLLEHYNIKNRFLFGLTPKNIGKLLSISSIQDSKTESSYASFDILLKKLSEYES